MAIDEVKFGELIGTVTALVVSVNDMKSALVPAIQNQQREVANLSNEVHDIVEWKDGKNGEKGAQKTLEDLERNQIRAVSFLGGVAFAAGVAGHKIAEFIAKVWN